MLIYINSCAQIEYSQLMAVYEQSNRENGAKQYPHMNPSEQLLQAEQDFYCYLNEALSKQQATCAVWAPNGRYESVLRLEHYLDGLLITGLETAPDARRKGNATCLLRAVLDSQECTVYSHVDKQNEPSIRLHEACGFRRIKDHAVFLDGSVSFRAFTYEYKKCLSH